MKRGVALFTLRRVPLPDPHEMDILLAQKCLEHDAAGLAHLRSVFTNPVISFIVRSGATREEAAEIVESLWADCLSPGADGQPRLSRYNGACSLLTWLNTVAFNALLTRKRSEARRYQRFVSSEVEGVPEAADQAGGHVEAPLLDLLRDAIEFAFCECSAEDFVLLQLEHCDGLQRRELARMFACSQATVSRRLSRAQKGVSDATLEYLRTRDPWLEIKWGDLIQLCRAATPACFGLED